MQEFATQLDRRSPLWSALRNREIAWQFVQDTSMLLAQGH